MSNSKLNPRPRPVSEKEPAAAPVAYYMTKTFQRALNKAFLQGGRQQKKEERVRGVLGRLDQADPFVTLHVTHHGETRLKNCVKYDLSDGWRLVTKQTEKTCTFLYMGDKEDTENWLNNHYGEEIGVKDRQLVRVPGVSRNEIPSFDHIVEHHYTPLVELVDSDSMDHVLVDLPPTLALKLGMLTRGSNVTELESVIIKIADQAKAEFVRSVFRLLLSGDVQGAQAHIDLSRGSISHLDDVDPLTMLEVEDGDEVRRIRVGSAEYQKWLLEFQRRSSWQDWFLFLHPEQEKVVKANYQGSAQLSGVSGSGKTCVVVRRALRLAENETSRVLILTLNRSLAGLLRQLVESACGDEPIRERIVVTSFFELSRALLVTFEPENARHYEDVTWKLGEHVDEVFREYYRQWTNNRDAAVLLALHKSLNARGVAGETYVRQEFDWIRSAVGPTERAKYLEIERKGRKIPLLPERRRELLQGLYKWERKMEAVGVVDYLGLTSALTKHLEKLSPVYTNVLVDEAQDFGTTELRIVRQLVSPGPNEIFLCGDIAQTVLAKHRLVTDAGIVAPVRERIRRNYRNSREILIAAYELLKNNLSEEMFESEDLEILDPELANFSGPAPMALAAHSLEEEIAFARAYAATATRLADSARTVCIAFAGFSARDVAGFAKQAAATALNGAYDPKTDRLVFSDLEETKGYEFDTVVIVNCCDGVLPARGAPAEELFRDACKLYVAMTRAKRELILSFNGAASPWILDVSGTIAVDRWEEVEARTPQLFAGVPDILPEIDPIFQTPDAGALSGLQYLYTSRGLGLSLEAQDKLIELVDGKGARQAGRGPRIRWANVRGLAGDLLASRNRDTFIGPRVAEELRLNLRWLGLSAATDIEATDTERTD